MRSMLITLEIKQPLNYYYYYYNYTRHKNNGVHLLLFTVVKKGAWQHWMTLTSVHAKMICWDELVASSLNSKYIWSKRL